jgi:hypothetical protein
MKKVVVVAVALSICLSTRQAWAQGCILIRESAPIIGAASSTYLRPGEWQFDIGFRNSTADQHYSGDVYQAQRTELGTNVINNQNQLLFDINHQVTPRFGFAVLVPFIKASWSVPSPIAPTPGPRAVQHGAGIGDISGIARLWVLDPLTHHSRNFSVGLGLKVPTGNADDQDTFVNITGNNPSAKAVDQSVQPGDGGWGTQVEVQGFSRLGPTFLFGSANYLINPRDTNETPSVLVGLGVPSVLLPIRNVNSVPDQYVLRVGIGVPIYKGLGASVAWRMEGVPRYDLIGRSDGFRRPGNEQYIEPGVSYAFGRSVLQVNIPLGYSFYRAPDPYTGAAGDATFPGVVATASYSWRFGEVKHIAMPGDHTAPDPGVIKRDEAKE